MAGWWRALVRAAQRHPWPTNVVLYTTLFSAGDVLQQRLRGGPADWRQTGRVATLAVTFQANFSYMWLRLLERALPGRTPRAILAKVVCDQMVGGPVALTIFYTGEGPGQGPGGQRWGSGAGHGEEARVQDWGTAGRSRGAGLVFMREGAGFRAGEGAADARAEKSGDLRLRELRERS